MMKRCIANPILIVAACLSVVAPVARAQESERDLRVDADDGPIVADETAAIIDEWLARMESWGMHASVLIARDGEVVLRHGYGSADQELGTRITSGTLFDIASVAEQFTAAAVLRLVMQGRIALDDPIDHHLDDVPQDKRGITIHHLLAHTSGLSQHAQAGVQPLERPLESQPGERFAHSGSGYELLAQIVESAAGESFTGFVEREIFAAAGLMRTGFRGRLDAPRDRFARAYIDSTAQRSAGDPLPHHQRFGAVGVVSCVDDLHRWVRSLRGGEIIDTELVEMVFTNHTRDAEKIYHGEHGERGEKNTGQDSFKRIPSPRPPRTPRWNPAGMIASGYGWLITTSARGTPVMIHRGSFGGFSAELRIDPDADTVIVLLSNCVVCGRSTAEPVAEAIDRFLHGTEEERRRIMQPPGVLDLHIDDVKRFVGEYILPCGQIIAIASREDHSFVASASGQRAIDALFAVGDDPAGVEFVESRNAIAVEVMTAAFFDDAAPLREHLDPALSFEDAWQGLRDLTRDVERRLGAFEGCYALGTAPFGGVSRGRTHLEIRCRGGSVHAYFTFAPDIVHFGPAEGPAMWVLRPIFGDTIGRFDIFTGRGVWIRMIEDPQMLIEAIEIDQGDGRSMWARRLESIE